MTEAQLESIYRGGFFKNRHKMAWRVPIVCKVIDHHIKFDSVVDVGCAIGDIVGGFFSLGKISRGIEGSRAAKEFLLVADDMVYFHDLRKRLDDWIMTFDLACCLEVAEHIEPEHAETFVRTLSELSKQILVSIAPPGQRGHHHVNCQPIEYWDKLFSAHKLLRDDTISDKIIKDWEPYRNKAGIKAYCQNLHFYIRE